MINGTARAVAGDASVVLVSSFHTKLVHVHVHVHTPAGVCTGLARPGSARPGRGAKPRTIKYLSKRIRNTHAYVYVMCV